VAAADGLAEGGLTEALPVEVARHLRFCGRRRLEHSREARYFRGNLATPYFRGNLAAAFEKDRMSFGGRAFCTMQVAGVVTLPVAGRVGVRAQASDTNDIDPLDRVSREPRDALVSLVPEDNAITRAP